MYVDLWGWFWQEEIRAQRTGDEHILRLVALARKGWTYRRSAESEKMLATFREATALAKAINHPCWELFCAYWSCSTLFYHVDDLQGAMRETVQLTSRAHLPQFEHCPIRGRIYFLLADIYYDIDVFGYEDKIRAALAHPPHRAYRSRRRYSFSGATSPRRFSVSARRLRECVRACDGVHGTSTG